MSERVFKIPEFEYFDMGGKYSGEKRGTSEDHFNYRITPKDDITVQIWYGINCFELSELVSETVLEKTRDGYHAMLDWIEKQYKIWLEAGHKPLHRLLGTWTIPEKNKLLMTTGKTDEELTPEERKYYFDLSGVEDY